MKKNILLPILLGSFCVLFSSCKFEIFTHDYATGSYELGYVDTNPFPPGVAEEEGNDGEDVGEPNDFWSINLRSLSLSELLNFIWSSNATNSQ